MSSARPVPHNLHALPTLTEVIEMAPPAAVGESARPAEAGALAADAMPPMVARTDTAPAIVEEEIVRRVLTELQRHADLMLEYRLREALTPVLARLTETLVRDLRQEMASTLREVVARAVSQELAGRRGR